MRRCRGAKPDCPLTRGEKILTSLQSRKRSDMLDPGQTAPELFCDFAERNEADLVSSDQNKAEVTSKEICNEWCRE